MCERMTIDAVFVVSAERGRAAGQSEATGNGVPRKAPALAPGGPGESVEWKR